MLRPHGALPPAKKLRLRHSRSSRPDRVHATQTPADPSEFRRRYAPPTSARQGAKSAMSPSSGVHSMLRELQRSCRISDSSDSEAHAEFSIAGNLAARRTAR